MITGPKLLNTIGSAIVLDTTVYSDLFNVLLKLHYISSTLTIKLAC